MRGRTCDITGKRRNGDAMSVSHSMRHVHRVQNVNLQQSKIWWEEGKKFVRLRLAAKTIRTIRKYGLDAVARTYGINLHKYAISFGEGPKQAKVKKEDVIEGAAPAVGNVESEEL
jgi:large subunit ribosomal protein L28